MELINVNQRVLEGSTMRLVPYSESLASVYNLREPVCHVLPSALLLPNGRIISAV